MKRHRWGELTARLRSIAGKRGYVTADDVRRLLGCSTSKACSLLCSYVRRGHMTRLERGRYKPHQQPKSLRMQILEMVADGSIVTAKEAAARTGCKLMSAHSIITRMCIDGEIRRVTLGKYTKVGESNDWQVFEARRRQLFETCGSAEEYERRLGDLERQMKMTTLRRPG